MDPFKKEYPAEDIINMDDMADRVISNFPENFGSSIKHILNTVQQSFSRIWVNFNTGRLN